MSRSEFFARAARCYLERLDTESLAGRIDAAVELVGTDDSAVAAIAAGQRLLTATDDQW